jgi:elongation factor Ts
MAQITAALVKELRERTGSGMMECKRALEATEGDIEAAIEHLRKTGQAKAERRADRTAAEGLIVIRAAADDKAVAMAEVNSETDFVAKNEQFRNFANSVVQLALAHKPASLAELLALSAAGGKTLDEVRKALIAEIGENINVRRLSVMSTTDGLLSHYLHGTRIGVVVELIGGDAALAKDIAMHIAASRPLCVSAAEIPPEALAKEREIYTAQAQESGKPAQVVEKMVEGKLRKFIEEVTLLGQAFVKDPDRKVAELLNSAGARVVRFVRFELGEGIEKRQSNFAAEVMAQAQAHEPEPDKPHS